MNEYFWNCQRIKKAIKYSNDIDTETKWNLVLHSRWHYIRVYSNIGLYNIRYYLNAMEKIKQ